MKRIQTIAVLGLATTLAGCQDMGLEDNLPLGEATDRPPSELVQAVYRPQEVQGPTLIIDGRRWVPAGAPLTVSADELRPIGSSDGSTFYARSWDDAPYDAVFTRMPGWAAADSAVFGPQEGQPWQAYEQVLGGPATAAHDAGVDDIGTAAPGH